MPRPMPRPPPVTSAVLPVELAHAAPFDVEPSGRDVLAGVGEHGHHVVAHLGEAAADLEPARRRRPVL